jgi:hypothetical protein
MEKNYLPSATIQDYQVYTRDHGDINLLDFTLVNEGADRCDSLMNVSCREATEVLPSHNPRTTRFLVGGAVVEVNHETGKVNFLPHLGFQILHFSFDRVNLNRRENMHLL